jgi:hypothetical protein
MREKSADRKVKKESKSKDKGIIVQLPALKVKQNNQNQFKLFQKN